MSYADKAVDLGNGIAGIPVDASKFQPAFEALPDEMDLMDLTAFFGIILEVFFFDDGKLDPKAFMLLLMLADNLKAKAAMMQERPNA